MKKVFIGILTIIFLGTVSFAGIDEDLFEAVKINDLVKVRELIDKGANVNFKDKYGYSILHLAVNNGNFEIVSFLIEKGADVKAKVSGHIYKGWTPLHFTAIYDKIKIAKLLLKKGVDVNAKDDKGITPLQWATGYGKLEIVKLFIENGADVNNKDNEGMTPLHGAVVYSRFDVIRLLIDKGADINAIVTGGKYKGYTPLKIAKEKRNKEIAQYLMSRGAKE